MANVVTRRTAPAVRRMTGNFVRSFVQLVVARWAMMAKRRRGSVAPTA